MLQVLVGALLALVTRWVFEGGIRRRNLHVVRDELEVAKLLDPDSAHAVGLRASAARKLTRHLQPTLWARARALSPLEQLIGVLMVVGLLGALAVWIASLATLLEGKSFAEGLTIAVTIGVIAGFGISLVETVVSRLVDRWVMPIVRRNRERSELRKAEPAHADDR